MECCDLPNMDLLSKSDPFVVVYLQDTNNNWNEIGRTEIVVNNLKYDINQFFYLYSPVFVKKILLTYKFEVVQKLKFCVYDADENAKAEDVNSIYLHLIQ